MRTAKSCIPALLLFVIGGCSSGKTVTVNASQENSNAASSNVSASESAPSSAAPSANINQTTQIASLDEVVKDLYKVHAQEMNDSSNSILSGKSRTKLDKYFDKNLADLIWKDLTTHQGEVGVLDFDPFYNSQDPDIKNLTVGAPKIDGSKATLTVSFLNSGRKDTLKYSLVQQNSTWRISDIGYSDGGSLLKYFKEDAASQNTAANNTDGSFEGTFQVGNTTCTVTPTKMAFELKWAKGSGMMMFFYEGQGVLKFVSEDNGKGVDAFIFDDANYKTGKFVRADGKEMPVKKIK